MGGGKRWGKFRRDPTYSWIQFCARPIVALLTLVAAGGVVTHGMEKVLKKILSQDIIDNIMYIPSAILLSAILAVTLHYFMGGGKRWDRFRRDRTYSWIRFLMHSVVVLLTLVAAGGIVILNMKEMLEKILPSDIISNITYTPSAMLLGAILAVALHYAVYLIVTLSIWLFLDEIPKGFYHAVAEELQGVGYYRISTKVEIRITKIKIDGDEKEHLEIAFSSDIVGTENTFIDKKYYHSDSSEKITPKEIHYKIGNEEWRSTTKKDDTITIKKDDTITIKKGERISEAVKVYYDLERDELIDDHMWRSPVSGGFSVTFRLPGYKYSANITRGPKLHNFEDNYSVDGGRCYSYSKSLFSKQGFKWFIEKEKA